MFKRIALCAAASVALLFSTAFAAPGNMQPFNNAAQGVVLVQGGEYAGPGFALGGEGSSSFLFVTWAGYVENANSVQVVANGESVPANVLLKLDTLQVAVLVTEQTVENCPGIPIGTIKGLASGDALYAVGVSDEENANGKLELFEGVAGDPYKTKDFTLITSTVQAGTDNLGAPLLNGSGQVIGMCLFPMDDDSGRSLAVPIDYIVDETTKKLNEIKQGSGQGQPQGQPQNDPQENPQGNDGLFGGTNIWIILGAAAVIGLVIRYFINKNKTKPQHPYNDVPSDSLGSYPAYEQDAMPYTQDIQPAGGAAARYDGGTPQIVGAAGHFLGNRFAVRDSIRIGRDPKQCAVIFPKQTPGVSALHCEVRNVGGRLELVDRGSRYGTFLLNGTKLAINQPQPLNPGDSFYLGARDNQFRVL